jgi:hypothetical protein
MKRNLLILLIAVGVIAVTLGVARALSGTHPAKPTAMQPAPGASPTFHARAVVDGKEWRVKTYENSAGQLCLFQGASGEGEGGTCLDRRSIFSAGPVRLYYGSSQNPGNTTTWDRAWVWGVASPRVAKLELVLTNCAVIPLHTDAAGIFQHVLPARLLHTGALPAKLVARGADGAPLSSENVALEPALPSGRTGSCA